MNNDDPTIRSQHVEFTYDGAVEPAVHDTSLAVEPGECVVLCGASGCGKTTYTRIINALVPSFFHGAFSGRQYTCGLDTAGISIDQLTPLVGSVFQNPKTQYFNANTTDELAFPAENMGYTPEEINRRIGEVCERFGIAHLMDRSIFRLSGGQKQRIAMAAAVVLSPKLVVLDEPTSNLDAAAIADMRQMIEELKAQGMTVVIAEHRLAWLNGVADRYVVFDGGRIVQDYAAEEFLSLGAGCIAAMGLRALDLEPYRAKIRLLDQPVESSDAVVRTRGLRIGYRGREAFARPVPDMAFHAGQIVGVMGGNGCGKSTLVRTLTGLIEPLAGAVELHGKPAKPHDLTRAGFMVMQDVNYQLFSDGVRDELLIGLDDTNPQIVDQANKVLASLDLAPFAERHPMSLSGGQKQRVAIASALMSGKEFIVLDEPTSGLDRFHMEQVGRLLRQLADQGKAIAVVTHDEELAAGWCDRIINLERSL
ncbi:ABC transporter ATP-binding protein [Bifidobacterium oedipodis]|uniref:ABC transporter ATP-binding protein n=1 Tax=Bifidobacterium oedipodis TaxID=2675322 RepID=A0A7Y0EQ09_9BIFI|nr:energy-coupling factor ABC transporter ATP-binding protein [Bifidobacterium sp. DSM 109957]NMM94270.1 ABC transporter ATP-binding protein [Bifidobacterium sp. DSM 109957]